MARTQSTEAIIRVRAEESVSKTADVIRREMDRAADSARGVTRGVDGIGRSILTAKEKAAVFAGGLNAAVGLLQTAVGAANHLKEAVGAAAQSIAVETRFTAIAGGVDAAAKAMDRLTAASAGGIDGTSLQQFGVKAAAAGVSLDQLETLLRGANKAAQATGQSQSELTEKFVQGIADLSDGVFRGLGLQVDFGQAVGRVAKDLGVSADALGVNEKRQILLAKAMEETQRVYGATELDETLVRLNQIDAGWANLTDTATRGLAAATVEAARLIGVLEGKSQTSRLLEHSTWTDIAGGVGAAALAVARLNPVLDAAADHLVSSDEASAEMAGSLARLRHAIDGVIASQTTEAVAARQAEAAQRAHAEAVDLARRAREAQAELLRDEVSKAAEATRQQYEHALALARTASAMGETAIATGKYSEAIKLAEAAGVTFVQREAIKRESVLRTNAALLETLQVQAEVAIGAANFLPTAEERDAAFREAGELLDRYNQLRLGLDELVSDPSVPSAPSKGAGKGRPADIITAAQSGASRRGRDDSIEPLRQARREIATGDGTLEIIDQERAALAALASQMDATARSSMGMAQAMASSFGGVGSAVANASEIIVSQVDQISAVMAQLRAAGLDSSKAFTKSVPGMLAASGALAAGFVGDQQTQAAIMAAMEGAAAVGSFAIQDYYGGAMHLLSAGLYAAVAGGAFGGGGGGGGAGAGGRGAPQPRMPDVGIPGRANDSGGNYTVQINMSGATIVGSDRRRLKADFAAIIAEAAQTRVPRNFLPA